MLGRMFFSKMPIFECAGMQAVKVFIKFSGLYRMTTHECAVQMEESMRVVDHNAAEVLYGQIDLIVQSGVATWGMVNIRRDYLRAMTNEALLISIEPLLRKEQDVTIYFIAGKLICILWHGNQKEVYRMLRSAAYAALILPGVDVAPSTVIAYMDPLARGDDMKALVAQGVGKASKTTKVETPDDDLSFIAGDESLSMRGETRLSASEDQTVLFEERKLNRIYRKRLQVLIVEDQAFSQRILCEVLRGARSTTYHDGPEVDTATGIHEAWKKFIGMAHDIVFVDLNLVDGSGHVLARAIKEIDPVTHAIIVTANSCEQEISVARQNNIDGFIGKPYTKKQILDCLDKYLACRKAALHGGAHGRGNRPI